MGNPFVHVELSTDDVGRSKKFYKGLFDWKLDDMKMGDGRTYTTIGVGNGIGGGLMKKPMPEAPTMWLSYVEVADVKKTIAKARKLGAQIIVDYMEVPDMGALGIFCDPAGATLGLWQPKAPAAATAKRAKKAAKPAAKKPAKKAGKKR